MSEEDWEDLNSLLEKLIHLELPADEKAQLLEDNLDEDVYQELASYFETESE